MAKKKEKKLNVTAQQFACAMLLERAAADADTTRRAIASMGLEAEAAEFGQVVQIIGRRKAAIEQLWYEAANGA